MNSRRIQKEKETHTDTHIEPLKNRIEANKRKKNNILLGTKTQI